MTVFRVAQFKVQGVFCKIDGQKQEVVRSAIAREMELSRCVSLLSTMAIPAKVIGNNQSILRNARCEPHEAIWCRPEENKKVLPLECLMDLSIEDCKSLVYSMGADHVPVLTRNRAGDITLQMDGEVKCVVKRSRVEFTGKPVFWYKCDASRSILATAIAILHLGGNDSFSYLTASTGFLDVFLTGVLRMFVDGKFTIGMLTITSSSDDMELLDEIVDDSLMIDQPLILNTDFEEMMNMFHTFTVQMQEHVCYGGVLQESCHMSFLPCYVGEDYPFKPAYFQKMRNMEYSDLLLIHDNDHYFLVIVNHGRQVILTFDGLGLSLANEWRKRLPTNYRVRASHRQLQRANTCGPHVIFCAFAYVCDVNGFRTDLNFQALYDFYDMYTDKDNDTVASFYYDVVKNNMLKSF